MYMTYLQVRECDHDCNVDDIEEREAYGFSKCNLFTQVVLISV